MCIYHHIEWRDCHEIIINRELWKNGIIPHILSNFKKSYTHIWYWCKKNLTLFWNIYILFRFTNFLLKNHFIRTRTQTFSSLRNWYFHFYSKANTKKLGIWFSALFLNIDTFNEELLWVRVIQMECVYFQEKQLS